MDGYNNDKNEHGTIKTLVREAVNSDSPEATKERYPQHTRITAVAYRFEKGIYKSSFMLNKEN